MLLFLMIVRYTRLIVHAETDHGLDVLANIARALFVGMLMVVTQIPYFQLAICEIEVERVKTRIVEKMKIERATRQAWN